MASSNRAPVQPLTVSEHFERRREAALSLLPQTPLLTTAAQHVAQRFEQGGRLLAMGTGLSSTDAHHVSVEFVHPVIVGKRALPAWAVPSGVDPLRTLAQPADILLALATDAGNDSLLQALRAARHLKLLTVALTGPGSTLPAEHCIRIESNDPLIVKEVQVTAYHLLWELVHLYLR